MPTLPPTQVLEVRRPFLRSTALAAGVSPSTLKGPRFRRVFTGVYIDAAVTMTPAVRVAAALALHPPGAYASHASAARLYGVPLPTLPDEHVSVATAADRRRRFGIRSRVAPPGAKVVTVGGLRASSPAQTFTELGELLGLVDLVVAGDHLVRRGRVTVEQLRRTATGRAARAAAYVREQVDSPMETRLRMLLVLAGLPEPVVNHIVLDAAGRVLYRFDLSYPELRILVEYDGRQHRADLDQWDHDTDRKDWLDAQGWLHVPVFSRGIYRDPAKTVARVEAALRSRGGSVPRQLSEEWRAHFPGH